MGVTAERLSVLRSELTAAGCRCDQEQYRAALKAVDWMASPLTYEEVGDWHADRQGDEDDVRGMNSAS